MLRFAAIALLLLPGVAHAQKFVSPGEDPATETSTSASAEETATATSINDDAFDVRVTRQNIVSDGATKEEIEQLLANARSNAIDADEENLIVARVATDDDGGSVLMLDVNDSDGARAAAEDADIAELDLGECNEGTNWVSDDINCLNYYPTDDN